MPASDAAWGAAEDAGNRLVAVTGASGFVGSHCVAALAARGFRLRILTRRDPVHELWSGLDLEAVPGDLEDPAALARLVAGADAVVHAAGLVRAPTRQEFFAVNRDGTRRLAEATRRHAPGAHLLLISSLAAREPQLSAYAASKRAGEDAAVAAFAAAPGGAAAGRLTVLRPAAIYGPGDRETLTVFKAAGWPYVPLTGAPGGRIALIHVTDVAAAVAALATRGAGPSVFHELADQTPAGYSFAAIVAQAAQAVGRRPRPVKIPSGALKLAGALADLAGFLARRPRAFGSGKVREMLHPDWSVRAAALPPADLWRAAIPLDQGFAETVRWYRDRQWLKAGRGRQCHVTN